jgi:THO complex subunit 7
LQEARHIRRIKIEYEALAAIIQTQPDRKSTQEKLSLLRQVLEASECECQKLEARLKQRRKQFHLLISTIQGLQQLLNDDEASQLSILYASIFSILNNANKYKSFETQKNLCMNKLSKRYISNKECHRILLFKNNTTSSS